MVDGSTQSEWKTRIHSVQLCRSLQISQSRTVSDLRSVFKYFGRSELLKKKNNYLGFERSRRVQLIFGASHWRDTEFCMNHRGVSQFSRRFLSQFRKTLVCLENVVILNKRALQRHSKFVCLTFGETWRGNQKFWFWCFQKNRVGVVRVSRRFQELAFWKIFGLHKRISILFVDFFVSVLKIKPHGYPFVFRKTLGFKFR